MINVASAPTTGGWRFRVGIICFVAAFGIHLITLVAMAAGAGAGTVAAIAAMNFAVNKILLLATVAVLGKPGFNQLKQIVLGAIGQYAPPQKVGTTRYTIGLVLFVIPILIGWVTPYLGDMVPLLRRHSVSTGITGDIILLLSLFVLGGDFWDKLRALFIRDAKVVFPEKAAAA
jgi:hypothetical protein